MSKKNPRPEWLSIRLENDNDRLRSVEGCLVDLNLKTVCSNAKCPNRSECYSKRRATFIMMGENCTRRCGFCAIGREQPQPLDPDEPLRIANAVKRLDLSHAVITSVTRDDLLDGGAEHFNQTVTQVRKINPNTTIEILVPDFAGNEEAWCTSAKSRPDVYNHNVETVPRLYETVRPIAEFDRSVAQLAYIKEHFPDILTKSGMMVGLGEKYVEIIEVARKLREAQVDIITVGQYLSPINERNLPVKYYMPPEEFAKLEHDLKEMGFASVAAAPFVRSSYNAEDVMIKK